MLLAAGCHADLIRKVEKTELGEITTYFRNGTKIFYEEYFDIGSKEDGRRYYDQSVIMDGKSVLFLSTFLITPRWDYKSIEGLEITTFPKDNVIYVKYKNSFEGFTITDEGLLTPFDDETYKKFCTPEIITEVSEN